MLTRSLLIAAASIPLLILLPAPSNASVLYSTLGPGNSYAATGGVLVSGSGSPFTAFSEADEFSASFSGQLTGISVAVNLGSIAPANGGFFDLEVASNNPANNLPLVANAVTVGTLQATSTMPTVLSLGNPTGYTFTSGSLYWLILAPHSSTTDITWEAAVNSAATATAYMSATTGGQFAASSNPANAFEVSADVPEPSTEAFLLAAAVLLSGAARWRRKDASLLSRGAINL